MVIADVIHPSRNFDVLFRLRNDRRVGLGRIVGAAAIIARAFGAFGVLDDIGTVVGDDVHIDFHAPLVRGIDKCLELGVSAEMWIDGGEVGHPVTVVSRRFLALAALHGLVLKDRGKPDRSRAHPLNVIQPFDEAHEIPAVIEAFMRRIVPVLHPVAVDAAFVILDVAVFKAVGQHEVDHLVFRQPFAVGLGHGWRRERQRNQAGKQFRCHGRAFFISRGRAAQFAAI